MDALHLPEDAEARNQIPLADGLLYYFPKALAAVAQVSLVGSQQHNPGQPMHWDREKSRDHANKIMRHLVDAGKRDSKGVRHSAYMAWRALALLQEEIERDEAPPVRGRIAADDYALRWLRMNQWLNSSNPLPPSRNFPATNTGD